MSRAATSTSVAGVCTAALAIAACASGSGGDPAVGGSPTLDGSASASGWARSVTPFPVLTEDGAPYESPFLGGFNVPRPQLADIDGDGDLDVFIQETTDRLLFFERGDGPDGPTYTWRPEAFAELKVGEWYRFVDVDADGDRDLLAESPFSYVRLFRNDGSAGAAAFELIADTLRDTRGEAIFSDRQNIPNASDIDCDGLLDLFIGRLVGTVTRYEATGAIGANASPFRHITDRFEDIEIVADPAAQGGGIPGRLPGSGPGTGGGPGDGGPGLGRGGTDAPFPTLHGANTMALADVDADGDVDMFWGDFFEAGLLYIENAGSCEAPNLRVEPRPFPLDDPIQTSGYNAPTFGDVDGDGDLDLLMGVLGGAYNANTTTADNLLLFTQGADGGFTLETSRFISQIDVGSESVPALVDLDDDGDLDLLVSNKIDPDDLSDSKVFLFRNDGSAAAPAFQRVGEFELDGAYHNAPAFGDLDADGDLDMLLGTWRDEIRYLRNEGSAASPRFSVVDSAFVELTRGSNATPTLGDLDGDGDLDLIAGESSGTLNYYENTGTAAEPVFELVSDEYGDFDVGRRSFPELVDFDGDGDLDLVVGTESDGIVYFENAGDRSSPRFVETASPFPPTEELPVFVTPKLADLDGDGDLDLLTGTAGGGLRYYERR
ncbi:MAG: VCBS repeat-containing protein [Gemmatimonadetes bacterium]|nr:VCBS repeat-containing protein [Gemmatimonadota bacterium]